MRTTNLLLDLNPTFNNCIPTFGPPCSLFACAQRSNFAAKSTVVCSYWDEEIKLVELWSTSRTVSWLVGYCNPSTEIDSLIPVAGFLHSSFSKLRIIKALDLALIVVMGL